MNLKPGTKYRIDFEPAGRRGYSGNTQSLLEASIGLGLQVSSLCGGRGTCRRCRIKIIDGRVSPPAALEEQGLTVPELQEGFRLACQTYPLSDCKVHVPAGSLSAPQRTQVEGQEFSIGLDPPVRPYPLSATSLRMVLPTPEKSQQPPDPKSSAQLVLTELRSRHGLICDRVDTDALQTASEHSSCQVLNALVRDNEIIGLQPGTARLLGLAVDLGTTKLAGYLLDLETGKTLAAHGVMNPQISYGEDVISRLAYASKSSDGARRLQQAVIAALNDLAATLCQEAGTKLGDIVETVIAGNTAMHHLMAGLPVDRLAVAPYEPAVKDGLHIKARELGFGLMPGTYVYLPPIVDGFVGSDHVAMLLATDLRSQVAEPYHKQEVVLALDIGTNTEVSLWAQGRISTLSCASGPAFEGAHIKDGMRAAPGAIESLQFSGDRVTYQTIDGAAPAGLCGSGILDAVAQLHAAGIVNRTGRMSDHERVRTLNGQREFIIVEATGGRPAITITQGDIREIQLAKSAIRIGIDTLLASRGYRDQDLDRVIIAGAFGSYIDVASVIQIGMLPDLPLDRFRQVGNAAGTGARMMTLSKQKRQEAETLVSAIDYIELTTDPSFAASFVKSTLLGHTNAGD